MTRPHVEVIHVALSQAKRENRSERCVNSIIVVVNTTSDDSIQLFPSVRVNISLPRCLSSRDIARLVQDQLITRRWLAPKMSKAATKLGFSRREVLEDSFVSHRWLSGYLAPEIEAAASQLYCFCRNGLTLTIAVNVTPSPSKEEVLQRMVQLGKMNTEDLMSFKMETEPCSICLDSLVSRGSNSKHGVPTRMTCSHVFHDRCLLEWLQRKNTCPLCRVGLYDRSMICRN